MVKFNRDFDDEPQVYDEAEQDPENENSSLLLAVVISLLLLVALGGVVWLAYNSGVAHGQEEALQKAAGATKSLPADSSVGSAVDSSKTDGRADGAPAAADSAPAQSADAVTPPQAPVTQPPIAQVPVQGPAPTGAPQAKAPPPPSKTVEVKKAEVKPVPKAEEKPQSKPLSVASAQTATKDKPATKQAQSVPVATTKPPVGAPANLLPASKTASGTKDTGGKDSKDKAKTVVPVTSAPAKAVAAGGAVLQIGAYKSEAEAQSAWAGYKAKHAGLVSGYSPNVQKVDLGDKGVWYRLRMGPFGGKEAAAALCEKLKASGGACIPTK